MKISIITVCFNSAETIEDTISSVIGQSHKDIEYIIIDGGSTDETLSIIEKYKANISYFVSEPDKGLYDAMNKGISAATGDAVGILNSDDVFFNDHVIEKINRELTAVDAVYGDIAFYKNENLDQVVRHYSSAYFTKNKLSSGIMPAHPSLYVKRNRLLEAGLYDTHYKIASDFDMIVRLFGRDDFNSYYIPEVLVKMRTGGVSTSGLSSNFLLNKEIFLSCSRNGIKTNWIKILSKYPRKLLGYVVK